jgi:hypothetical protein
LFLEILFEIITKEKIQIEENEELDKTKTFSIANLSK